MEEMYQDFHRTKSIEEVIETIQDTESKYCIYDDSEIDGTHELILGL